MIGLMISLMVVLLVGCSAPVQKAKSRVEREREPIVGLPCEGCEAVFEGLPDELSSSSRIAPDGEPGQPILIRGIVRDKNKKSIPGVIVYAYHTNARGLYPPNERFPELAAFRHGLLRGWTQSDENGAYSFESIRPEGYPDSDLPAHVHMHIVEVGRCTYYIDDIMFEDDARLTFEKRQLLASGRGGSGIVAPNRDPSGRWVIERNITLGENIPGYPQDAEIK